MEVSFSLSLSSFSSGHVVPIGLFPDAQRLKYGPEKRVDDPYPVPSSFGLETGELILVPKIMP